MPETAENVAEDYQVARKDQDAFAWRSQQRAAKAQAAGHFAEEIEPVIVPGGKAGPVTVDKDEHLRPDTTLEGLAKLKPFARSPGTVTAGNASGVNDGAAAMCSASWRRSSTRSARPTRRRGHVSRAQRSTKWCAADPGPRFRSSIASNRGPGTAVHRCALHRIRDTANPSPAPPESSPA